MRKRIDVIKRGNAPKWDKEYAKFEEAGRTNGAAVYSDHFCRNIAPDIIATIKESPFERIVFITVWDLTSEAIKDADLIFVVLHVQPGENMKPYAGNYIGKVRELNSDAVIVSITSVWETHLCLVNLLEEQDKRYQSLFLPMSIDVVALKKLAGAIPKKKYQDRILFFGNSYENKDKTRGGLIKALSFATASENEAPYKIDIICNNEYIFSHEGEERLDERKVVDRKEMLKILKKYQYVVATSIAAQEAMELGAKVIFSGRKFGGVVTTDAEYDVQGRSNFSGDICTFSSAPINCWYAMKQARNYRAMVWEDIENGFIPDLISILAFYGEGEEGEIV